MAAGCNLLYAGIDAAKRITRVQHHFAAAVFLFVLALIKTLGGLLDLGAGHSAGVKRDIEFNADAALGNVVAIAISAKVSRVAVAKAVVVALAIGSDSVNGRCMPGLTLTECLLGSTDGTLAGLQLKILPHGDVDPGTGIIRYGSLNRHLVPHACN